MKRHNILRFFATLKMTKQRFVIGEFISVTMNEPMLFCFVIGEFCSNRSLAVWSSHTERVAIGKTSQ